MTKHPYDSDRNQGYDYSMSHDYNFTNNCVAVSYTYDLVKNCYSRFEHYGGYLNGTANDSFAIDNIDDTDIKYSVGDTVKISVPFVKHDIATIEYVGLLLKI